jgi:hypothetical protein
MGDLSKIDEAWDSYLEALKRLTSKVRGDPRAASPLSRADGYRMIQALATSAHLNILHPQPGAPELLENLSLFLNYCGPAADFKYCNAHLEPGKRYRFWGTRGSARLVDFQQCKGWWSEDSRGSTVTIGHASFDALNLKLGPGGAFELTLSPQPEPRNWLQADPNTSLIIVRQMFYDWENEEPGEIHCERIGGGRLPVETDPSVFAARVSQCARSVDFFGDASLEEVSWTVRNAGLNRFVERHWGDVGGQTNQNYFAGVFELQADESLMFEWRPPQTCVYWGLQLYDVWFRTLDFRNYPSSINGFQAPPDSDGVVRVLISPKDIGVAHWLDTVGQQRGYMLLRCKHERELVTVETPRLTAIRTRHFDAGLGGWRRVSPEERLAHIEMRRRHVAKRFGR